MAAPSLLLFGPVTPRPKRLYIAELQTSLESSSRLRFLRNVIEDLPLIWTTLRDEFRQLDIVPGKQQLETLANTLSHKALPDNDEIPNVASAPLTIISQIVEYLNRGQKGGKPALPRFGNVQGFCVGFLTAAVVACSHDEDEFRGLAAIAIRLAMCIGAIVDLDEASMHDPRDRSIAVAVQWRTDPGKEAFDRILVDYPTAYVSCHTDKNAVTVTVCTRDADSFTQRLSKNGLSAKSIGLRGRYHHSTHTNAAQQMKEFCKRDKRFQLPSTDCLVSPLRSNSDAEPITTGALHDIALDSILTVQSRWYWTVEASIAAVDGQNVGVKVVGANSIIPRTLTAKLSHPPISIENHHSKASGKPRFLNEIDHDSSLPTSSSRFATPRTDSNLGITEDSYSSSAIAVVGMACRFPKADSLHGYWQLLSSGRNAVQTVPKDRFDPAELWRNPKGPFWGNFITDPDAFDHRFFSISGREAKSMDPQQRLLLQVVYEAMESSGYFGHPRSTKPDGIGCYIGVGSVDYEDNVASENATAFSALGTLRAFIGGRLNHYFGWSGPSITFDTACSSSAVAIHSACKALQTGDCLMAIAGGVNVMTSPKLFQNLAAGGFLNPTGASKAFDASANGYCRGEGAGVVVLKPLTRAMADGDSVLGVISGSAVNQGSNCSPITVPVSESQSSLYRHALATAGIESKDVTYVEAHGTGTPVGDPIECESIRQIFGGPHRTKDLFVGSVKDNIGHAEAASGVAALIKTLLMMRNRTIPKQANFITSNPTILPLEKDRMIIPKQTQPWDTANRIAVINNYGAAGSNAAIVLHEQVLSSGESVTANRSINLSSPSEVPIFISAKTPNSLQSYCAALKSYLLESERTSTCNLLVDVAYNLATKQNRDLEYSRIFTAQDLPTLHKQLEASILDPDESNTSAGEQRPVILCFGGQNGRDVSLSKDLFNSCHILQIHLIECDSICKALRLPSILPAIFQTDSVEDIVELHCRLFSLQYSSAKAWLDCGLEVDTLIGHSFGQLTALCVADSLSLEDGIRLVSTRAQLIRDQWGPKTGAMLSIEGDHRDVKALLDYTHQQYPSGSVEISCYNGPRNFVVAGERASIEAIEAASESKECLVSLKLQRLKNTHAFHSHLVDSIVPAFAEVAESIHFKQPSILIETCSEGQNWPSIDANAVVQHSRLPVYFADAVNRITKRLGSSVWLEAGSGSPIIAMVRKVLQADHRAHHALQPIDLANHKAHTNLAKATSGMWAAGSKVQFWSFHRSQKDSYTWLTLPPYQFEKTRHWMEYKSYVRNESEPATVQTQREPKLLQQVDGDTVQALFSVDSTHGIFALCTKGHAVLHHSLCPASLYFELAIRAARTLAGAAPSRTLPRIQELQISSPLSLSPNGSIFLQLIRDPKSIETWRFSLFSGNPASTAHSTTHANGTVALQACDAVEATGGLQSFNRLVGSSTCEPIMNAPSANGLNGAMVYRNLGRVVDYASYYRGVRKVFAKDHEAVGYVYVPDDQPIELDPGCCDPIAIDNFLQVSGIHVNCLWECRDDEVYVCTAIRELIFSEQFMNKPRDKRSWTVYSNFELGSNGKVVNDVFVLESQSGDLVLTLMGAEFTRLPLKSLSRTLSKLNNYDQQDISINQKGGIGNCPTSDVGYAQQNGPGTPSGNGDSETSTIVSSGQSAQEQILRKLQEMLSEVLEIPIDTIQSESALDDLGIDSLMATEVISEIQTRLGIVISSADFQGLTDLQSLSHHLQPPASKQAIEGINSFGNESEPNSGPKVNGVLTPEKEPPNILKDQSEKGLGSTGPTCFANVKTAYDLAARETEFLGFSRNVHPLQSELVLAYVVEAFENLGCPLASLAPGHHLPEIDYSSKHEKVVDQLYSILEDGKVLTRSTHGFCRTEVAIPQTSSGALHAQIVQEFPQYASEHKLLHTTGPKLASCLIERDDPIALLFGSPQARTLMTDVYTNAPMFKAGTIALGKYLVDIFSQWSNDREIHILELGAGTGGTTSYLVDLLANRRQKFQYTFTDLSSSLVGAAKKRFAKYGFMKYTSLDVEQAPPSQHLAQYDIVISTNCVHATKNLVTSTRNINNMLRPDGILCLVELTRNLFWFDLVFGLLEGWWLFNDGRKHVLANEILWEKSLKQAGFQWIDWTEGDSDESKILRVIAASPSKSPQSNAQTLSVGSIKHLQPHETVVFGQESGTQLFADISYPAKPDSPGRTRPIALMIHGGGHVMLSRTDVRPLQTQILLEAGLLPVSIDYRLCPETTLLGGPMHDVRSALFWARSTLPTLPLIRPDIHPNGSYVVAVGWSTGGHLAMTLAWTAASAGIAPPDAILAFYCPTDYEDSFWRQPNMPRGADGEVADRSYDLWEAVRKTPITAYNPPPSTCALGGWLALDDPRSRICLHMNWKGQTLPVLINGLSHQADRRSHPLPPPTREQIQAISPLAQIHSGLYRTPTFIVHGTRDDLIPWQQTQRTYETLRKKGIEAEVRIVEGAVHLFDLGRGLERDEGAAKAIRDGYEFLKKYAIKANGR